MKTATIILFLLFCFHSETLPSVEGPHHLKWIEYKNVPEGIIRIIGGNSFEDFWANDIRGNLFHYYQGKWNTFLLNSKLKFRRVGYEIIDENFLSVFLVDFNWKAYLGHFDGKQIKLDKYIHDVPINGISNFKGQTYIWGDDGSLLQKKEGNWETITLPTKSHISTATVYDNYLWLGTQKGNLFRFDGINVEQLQFEENPQKTIIKIACAENGIVQIKTNTNEIYQFDGNVFKRHFGEIIIKGMELTPRGFVIQNPLDSLNAVLIPYKYKLKSMVSFSDYEYLVLTNDHKLLKGFKHSAPFFTEMGKEFGIKSVLPNVKTIVDYNEEFYGSTITNTITKNVITANFNKDKHPDFLIMKLSDRKKPEMFISIDSSFYSNLAITNGLHSNSFYSNYIYAADADNDSQMELFSFDYENSRFKLNMFTKYAGKYRKKTLFYLPNDFYQTSTNNLRFYDLDDDGDLDIIFSNYYSKMNNPGFEMIYWNNGFGVFSNPDSSLNNVSRGWNKQNIIADFNNDGFDDIFLLSDWRKEKILFNNGKEYLIKTLSYKTKYISQRKTGAIAIDYDNDADLDIILSSKVGFIKILENNGAGDFSEKENIVKMNRRNNENYSGILASGDFNNDGYLDLYITEFNAERYINHILINDSGKKFVDMSFEYEVSDKGLETFVISDIDLDGDLDILGSSSEDNHMLINTLNNNDYLRINLVGIKSNSQGIGSKIWVYESGYAENPGHLVGYRQIGSDIFGVSSQNELTSHFGVDSRKTFDVVVDFKGGEKKYLYNVKPSQTIEIVEDDSFWGIIYLIPGKIVRAFINPVTLISIASFALSLLIIFIGVNTGVKRFSWGPRISFIHVAINFSLFYSLINVSDIYNNYTNLALPVSLLLAGNILPLITSYWKNQSLAQNSDIEKCKFELFELLTNFSHGEWAKSNLNSLNLFFSNLDEFEDTDSDYKELLAERKTTFSQMTLPVIKDIANKVYCLDESKVDFTEFQNTVHRLETLFVNTDTVDTSLSMSFKYIINAINTLKNELYANYSCNPVTVLNNISKEYESKFEENSIRFEVYKTYNETLFALIKEHELADIIDNCLQNSIRAFNSRTDRFIIINLIEKAPKILIEIKDNGQGILPEDIPHIFDPGFSGAGSTGMGLRNSKESLKKYLGTIYLKESTPGLSTKFIIELQRGIKL